MNPRQSFGRHLPADIVSSGRTPPSHHLERLSIKHTTWSGAGQYADRHLPELKTRECARCCSWSVYRSRLADGKGRTRAMGRCACCATPHRVPPLATARGWG